MIHWGWLIAALSVGMILGVIVMSLLVMAQDEPR